MGEDGRSDLELLRAVGADDRAALRLLWDRHAPWLVTRLLRRCPDRAVVDETVQDTFVGVWRNARTYKGEGEVAAWIWGIAVRRLVDQLRRQPMATVPLQEPSRTEVSAEEAVLLDVAYGDVGRALARLSPELRAVVQATVLDGLTTREAGKLLGLPSGTVKTRMMRARAALREELA